MGRRAEARAGLKVLLDAYKTANTDSTTDEYLAHVYDHRPPRVTGRSAWVNKDMPESLSFGANVQTRVLQPSITVATKLASNDQATDEQDAIVDTLIDLAKDATTANAIRVVTRAPLLPLSVLDEEIESDDGIYAGVRVTFAISPGEGY